LRFLLFLKPAVAAQLGPFSSLATSAAPPLDLDFCSVSVMRLDFLADISSFSSQILPGLVSFAPLFFLFDDPGKRISFISSAIMMLPPSSLLLLFILLHFFLIGCLPV